jgi:hypothetical protein
MLCVWTLPKQHMYVEELIRESQLEHLETSVMLVEDIQMFNVTH